MIAEICEAFHCPPSIALKQNYKLVRAIFDYRLAKEAREVHNTNISKMTPEMVKLWKEMMANG